MGVKPNKHRRSRAKWRCIYWSPLCFSPRWRLTSIRNQQPPSFCFPTVPSLQLSCICGAITVRGRQQTHSLQSCWLERALYLLWDRLDLSNRLIFLFIFAVLCSGWVSLHVSVHCDQQGVTVHDVTFVTPPLLMKLHNLSRLQFSPTLTTYYYVFDSLNSRCFFIFLWLERASLLIMADVRG